MNILHQYVNGNTKVVLYDNGTKERTYTEQPIVLHPESIDVKITNYCDAGCSFCHEKSTKAGQHGDLNRLMSILSDLPPGVEIAIGGGNPLSHPQILDFLKWMQIRGLVANITINQKHLAPYREMILSLINDKLVRGVGISYLSKTYLSDIQPILQASDNVVFHVIMGVNKVEDVESLSNFCKSHNKTCKVLILGYKVFGFGSEYYTKHHKIEDNKYHWYVQLATYFKQDNLVLSFDNLAIEQLKLQRYFTKGAWEQFYMGDDFVFTMYIDGVNQQYAPSSTSNNRTSFGDIGLLDYFQTNRTKPGSCYEL